MSNISVKTASSKARNLYKELESRHLEIPDEVHEAIDAIASIEKLKPGATHDDLVMAYLDRNVKKINDTATRLASLDQSAKAWGEAAITVGVGAMDTMLRHGPAFIEQLRPQAEEAIEKVTAGAKLPADPAQLLREGRNADAEIASFHEINASDLRSLYSLRDKLGRKARWGTTTHFDCTVWRDPKPVKNVINAVAAANAGEFFRRGLKAGGELWWPTPSQAREAVGVLEAERQRQLDAQVRVMAAQGRLSGFGSLVRD